MNNSTHDAETTLSGSAFQISQGAATGKTWLPMVDSLKGDATR